MAPHREPYRGGTTTPPPADMDTLVEDELVVGEQYWMQDEKGDEVWTLAEVMEQCDGHVSIKLLDSGERKDIDQDLEEMFPKNPNVVADMTAMHHIHEPGILHNLKERSRPWRQTPYTFMGTILLAVNPLKAVPTPSIEDFKDHPLDPEMPHPYAIAELSYNQMRMASGRAGTNQSIVVSGESGAGKTETVKIILGYLARRTAGTDEHLEERVLESSPILESFGNAKTLRNDNSSRFGKFLKLRFTSGEFSYLDGASVEPYLLEKSRVLAQGEGERNFHILYEMIAGATQCGLAEELKLESASSYRILSSSGCITLEGVDDADRFKAIQEAFAVVGVEKDAQMQVWQALSGVLHLSTLSFHETDHQEGPVAAISDKAALSTTASLLGVSEQALEDMLTVKVVPVTRGEVFTKRLAVKEAVRARDAAIKSLYEAMFLWVVRAINLSLGGAKVAGDDKLPFIGLLDIFGFENFGTKNNLEQLLINYANESLQGDFNRQVFENELRVYAEEGIDVTVSAAVYTSSCLRMLTGKRDGVLPVLDDVCSQPLPTDKRYLERLHVAFSRRRGEGMDVTEKSSNRDVMSRSTRSSAGSDDGTTSVVSRKWGGSELGGTGSSTWTSDSSDVMSLEFVGKRGSFISSNEIMRTEQHESFWVNHYASKVLYTVEGWVERNMDSVPQSFSDTMLSSQHTVVFDAAMAYNSGSNGVVEKEKKGSSGASGGAAVPRKPGGRQQNKTLLTRRTVAGNFMASMQNLSTTLAATTCGFVRCIKPNAAMDFGIFDSHYVVEQLRCLGVLRTCEVLKVGMPTRVSYADLKKSLGDGIMEAEKMFEGQPEKSLVAAILWAFDVPSEAFRLGAKRVFFRSGQIAVLHKILNETPPDKLPWVLSRLRLALANRRMATVAAEEAEDALAEAEAAVMEAEALSSNTERPANSQNRVRSPLSPGASADEDMRGLVAAVDKARRAAQNAVQVKTLLKAAAAEGVGENASGASDKIQEAADAALADIAKASERANELERLTNVGVTGADGTAGETSAARELHAALRDVREGLINAQKLWRGAEEAADKCQAEGAVAKSKEAKEKAALVVGKAKSVAETSKHAIEVARRQRKCKEVTTRATEKALRTFRLLQVVARQATLEEKRARENTPAVENKKKSAASAPTPGRGLVSAAKAALANAVKYEDLNEDQKQQRAKEQKAASAEAAEAIAEAAKEEEQKRLELAALEKERMLELEEEAAAAAGGGDQGHANLVEVARALEGMGAAKSPGVGGGAGGTAVSEAQAAGAGGVGAAAGRGMGGSGSLRGESGNAAFDAGYASSSKAGKTANANGTAGAEVEGVDGSEGVNARRAKTSGWGENNDQTGPGSVKGRFGAFSGGNKEGEEGLLAAAAASAGVVSAAEIGVDGVDDGGIRAGRFLRSREGSGAIKATGGAGKEAGGGTPAAAAGASVEGAGGRVVAESSGWGENNDRDGPGSVKGRLGKFSGNSADGTSSSPSVSASGHGSPSYGSSASQQSGAGAGGGGDKKKPSDLDDFPKSFKDRLQAFSGGSKKGSFGGSGPRSVSGGSGSGGLGSSRSPSFKRGDSWRSGEIPASGARSAPLEKGNGWGGGRSPPYPGSVASGGSASSSTRSVTRGSPPGSSAGAAGGIGGGSLRRKGSTRREEAVAALAEAKAAEAEEEEEWARKMKVAEEERKRAREERKRDAAEAAAIVRQEDQRDGGGGGDEGAGGRSGGRGGGRGGAGESGDEGGSDGSGRGSFRGGDDERDASAVAGRAQQHHQKGRDGVVPPLARMGSGGSGAGGKKRSIRKSGYPYGGGADGGGGAATAAGDGGRHAREYGSGSSREGSKEGDGDRDGDGEDGRDGDGGSGGSTTKIRPWPEAAIAGVEDDEDGDGMEAKKPLNGWQNSSAGMVPWRSPERAPEYGGSGPAKKEFVRRASFQGDPIQSRNAPWERSDGNRTTITRNLSLSEDMGQDDVGLCWTANPKEGGRDGSKAADGAGNADLKVGSGAVILESMLFKDDAKEIGVVELKVMNYNCSDDKQGKPPRRAPTWTQYYFRLKSEVLTKSPPRRSSFPGAAGKSEEMKLSSSTVTSYTNTKNCFCVRTKNMSWFLLARSLDDMKRWMSAINNQTRLLFQKEHGVHDDYMGQGRRGRFFYRMVEGSVPQWILTHPMAKAPRAGDGLFPGEVIEVTQVLSSGTLTFLRLANNRGWTYARSPTDGGVLFEDLAGGVSEDTEEYSFPSGAKGIVPILHGPGLRTQATGVTIRPGERVRAAERFTPVDNTRVVFVKLEDERGWIPVKTDVRGPATVLQGW